jgi:phenylacetate-coenzyme A ligase PaaK-like adenylate-forming protein
MLRDSQPADRSPHWQDRLSENLQKRIGIRFRLELVPQGGLARSEYKAKRWLDQRVHAR